MLLWEALCSNAAPGMQPGAPATSDPVVPRRLPFDTRCAAITKSGRRCRGRIREGTEYCVFHDPAVAERRRRAAGKRGRARRRLAHLPGGYLAKLTSRRAVGQAMDRLYREIRLGLVTPEMGRVLFDVLTRLLDSGLCDEVSSPVRDVRRTKAQRLRPKLAELLTQAERRAWRKAVANAPAAFLRTLEEGRDGGDLAQSEEAGARVVLPAAS